jgi:hypothetical protein
MKKSAVVAIPLSAFLTIVGYFADDYLDLRGLVYAQSEAQAAHEKQAAQRFDELREQQKSWRDEYRDDREAQRARDDQILGTLMELKGRLQQENDGQ